MRQQLRLPGEPGHQQPLPGLLPGRHGFLRLSLRLAAVALLLVVPVPGGVQVRRAAAREAVCDGGVRRPACGATAGAGVRQADPDDVDFVVVVRQPVPELPEARRADGVPVPLRGALLRRAPLLGPPRLLLRLQGRRQGRHRQGEPRRARRQDRQVLICGPVSERQPAAAASRSEPDGRAEDTRW